MTAQLINNLSRHKNVTPFGEGRSLQFDSLEGESNLSLRPLINQLTTHDYLTL